MFEDAPLDQAVEGVVNGIFFNQGHVCCAGSRLLVQEPVFDALLDKLKDRLQTLRVGDPLDKNTDVGAINSQRAARARSRSSSESGVEEGAEIYQPACDLPERGFWFRPTLFTGVSQSHRIAREEIFGPVLSILTFRTPEEAVEKANNTPYGLSAGVWTEKGSRILWMAQRLRAGVVWANTFNRFDPDVAVRRLQGERVRPRGRAARPRALPHVRRGRVDERARRRSKRTAKLFIGGAFPRSESGRSYEVAAHDGKPLAYAAQASRKDLREAVVAARAAFPAWSGTTAYHRGQILYRVAELMEGRRAQFGDELADAGAADPDRGVDAAIDRWVWYAGWADKIAQVARRRRTPSPARTSTSRSPSRPASWASWRRATSRCSGSCRGSRRRSSAGTPRRDRERTVAAAGGLPRRGARHQRRPRRRREHPHRRTAELVPWLASHMDVNAIDVTGVPDELGRHRARGGRQREAGAPRPDADPFAPRRRARTRSRRSWSSRPSGTRWARDRSRTGLGSVRSVAPDLADAGAAALSVRRGARVPGHGPGGRRASAAPLLPGAR